MDHFQSGMIELRRRVYRLEAASRLAEGGRKARFPIEFTSQFGEDLLIWDLLDGQTEGYFVEVGAYDGYQDSVSYPFEAMGWNGLLIEALPHRAGECAARRPFSRVVHAALSHPGAPPEAEFTAIESPEWDRSSFLTDRPRHQAAVNRTAFSRRRVRVPVQTMDDLLRDYAAGVPRLDFAVIDVEGAELDVLRGFDLARHRPRVLLLEDNTLGQDPALGEYMKTQPYTGVGWLRVNQIYVHRDEHTLLDRVKRIRL